MAMFQRISCFYSLVQFCYIIPHAQTHLTALNSTSTFYFCSRSLAPGVMAACCELVRFSIFPTFFSTFVRHCSNTLEYGHRRFLHYSNEILYQECMVSFYNGDRHTVLSHWYLLKGGNPFRNPNRHVCSWTAESGPVNMRKCHWGGEGGCLV